MKLNLPITTFHDVNISAKDFLKLLEQFFYKEFSIDHTSKVIDGKLVNEVEYHTSHSWFDKVEVRDATSKDQGLIDTLHELYEVLK